MRLSRNSLSIQIETKLYTRTVTAVTNFEEKLSLPKSDLAKSTLKNPYWFDFLSLRDKADEREVEKGFAEYRLEDALPDKIKTALPTIEEPEAELSKRINSSEDDKNGDVSL